MVVSGLQHISKCLDGKDIPSTQQWLKRMVKSLPDIHTERTYMDNKPKFVPQEMKGRMTKNIYKKSQNEPDWKGSFMYKGEVINFGAWENDAGYGVYYQMKINDPNWNKQQKQYPREVTDKPTRNYPRDSDVPF